MQETTTGSSRILWAYFLLSVILLLCYGLAELLPLPLTSSSVHTLMELASTQIALIVGVIALLRYYSLPDDTVLLIGVGFIGTALLDGYHGTVTSTYFVDWFPSLPESLIPWSWNASRSYLGVVMLLTWVSLHRKRATKFAANPMLKPMLVYPLLALLTFGFFVLFAFVPLGQAYFPEALIGRPEEYFSALLLLIALIGCLRIRAWQHSALVTWLIAALIVAVASQLLFMPRSKQLFDGMFSIAHFLKLLSYAFVLIGLLRDVYAGWQRERLLVEQIAEANEQLGLRNAALESSNLELQRFAYIASHDLQSPLRSIGGFAQLLQKNYIHSIDERGQDWFRRIVANVEHLSQMISDVLSFSKVDERARPFTEVDMNEVVADVVELLDASITDAGAEIHAEELPLVIGDRSQLVQLMQNLVGNAIKYHGDAKPAIHITTSEQDLVWQISVRDNGIGVNQSYGRDIFEPFKRLHSKQEYPGTGIGLAVCRRIVTRHYGKIWYEPVASGGTEFIFELPKRQTSNNADDAVVAD